MIFEKYLLELFSMPQGKTTSRNWSVVFYKIQMLFFCFKIRYKKKNLK